MRIKNAVSLYVFGVHCSTIFAYSATVTVSVVDEDRQPIEGANVRASFDQTDRSFNSIELSTDAEGRVEFVSEAHTEVIVRIDAKGYYDSSGNSNIMKVNELRDGFETFDPRFEFVMKEIRDPIPLLVWPQRLIAIPSDSEVVGIDLMKGDLVTPLGNGIVSDIEVSIDGYYENYKNYYFKMVLNFPNEGDGFVKFDLAASDSKLKSSHLAPDSDYQQYLEYEIASPDRRKLGDYKNFIDKDLANEDGLYLRFRSRLGTTGDIEEGHYGKIYGGISFRVPYEDEFPVYLGDLYVNPNLSDRNVEFDINENLVDLPLEEKVIAP